MERWMKVPLWSGVATVVAGAALGGVLMAAPSGHAAPGTERGVPECAKADLSAKYRGGDAATSHRYGRIVLRNTSEHACFVKGYGGLSYVGKGNGTQIGAPADRTPSPTPRTVLQPGDKVRSAVVETSTGPYSAKECRPTKVDGFRVYVPDETRSFFIAHRTTGCANPKIHLLSHKAYR
ncbi:DUF4232 domain-containing protein [Nocardioides halotolerans]|jgi:hypothetical protein|uniref:DUF4232 domain-containing protein n=1 Tax=Nocardioides halotolerans TaxID=433660 RepID=UPI0003FAAFDE|nr:DUF4232 domain-containing protein [Nocardioides halotolerans]